MSHILVMVSFLVLHFLFHFYPIFVGPGDAVGSCTMVIFLSVGFLEQSGPNPDPAFRSGVSEVAVSPVTASRRVDTRALKNGNGQCSICTTQYAKIATCLI